MAKKQKRALKEIFILGLVILLIVVSLYYFKSIFIAASVNGQFISRLAVVKELEKQSGKKTLDLLITKTLILQEAKKRKLVVDQKQIDAEIKKIEANITSQGATLDQLLAEQGMTKKDLTEEIKIQMLVQKMVGGNIQVTDQEVEEYISSNKGQEISKDQAMALIKQQKLQQKIQTFVTDLKSKAEITYFVNY